MLVPPPQAFVQGVQVVQESSSHFREQASVWQSRMSVKCGQATPLPIGLSVTTLFRSWTPPSHLAEHEDQLDHIDTWQSFGQIVSPQCKFSDSAGHAEPPF